jgi:hypothetical protein
VTDEESHCIVPNEKTACSGGLADDGGLKTGIFAQLEGVVGSSDPPRVGAKLSKTRFFAQMGEAVLALR